MSPLSPAKVYFLMPEPLNSQYVETFLGRVVVNKSRPTDNYSPDISINLNDLVPGIYEEPASFKDIKKVLSTAHHTSAKLAITKLLEVFRESSTESGKLIEAPLFRRYKMTRIPQKFEELCRDSSYLTELIELNKKMERGQHLSLVTGLLTCTNHRVTEEEKTKSSAGGRIGIHSGAIMAAGGPPGIETQLSARAHRDRHTGGRADADGEMVLAVSYHQLDFEQQNWGRRLLNFLFGLGYKPTVRTVPILGNVIEGDLEGFFGASDGEQRLKLEDAGKGTGQEIARDDALEPDQDENSLYDFQLCLE